MRRLPVAAAVAAACLAGAAWPHAQVPVFVSRRDVVRLDVLVSDRSRPVLGLKTTDFTVLDNGVPQEIEYLSFDELPLNIVMAFDVSGSMHGQRFEDLRAAGQALVNELRRDDRAALVSIGTTVSLGTDLTTDLDVVRGAINWGVPGGQTALIDGAFAGLTIAASDTGRSLMLVFSDGLDTSSWLEPKRVLDAARRASVVVFGVAEGRARNPFLEDLVDVSGGDLIEVRSTRDLKPTFIRLLAEYRHRYIVGYSPAGVASGGWHKVDVKVSRRGVTVKARPGYQGR